jgi:tetratricopeptide (TPR) repeat protein
LEARHEEPPEEDLCARPWSGSGLVDNSGRGPRRRGEGARRKARPRALQDVLLAGGAETVRARAGDAALVLFPETIKTFSAIPQTDPTCAIAYWGIAISQRPNPLVPPFSAEILKRGLDAIEKGEAVGAKTQRERDWLAALKEFYKDHEAVDQDTRSKNYEKAMEALVKKYPDDVEAKIFYALALNETFDHKNMDPLLKAIGILEPIDRKYPDHPGVTHYLIHSYDFPPIAPRGVPAANKYAKIAPSAPHALHMPSHIYSMVGMWEQSIVANQRTIASSNAYAEKNNLGGIYPALPHSWDFMEYAYLQLGQDSKAKALVEEVGAVKKIFAPRYPTECGAAATQARYFLERQDWKGAAALPMLDIVKSPQARAVTHFARAVGAARSDDFVAAQTDIDALKDLRGQLEKANQGYWAGQTEIQILAAQAWVAQGQKHREEALRLMRAAADLEDASEKHVAMENRLYPMRELFADMLMIQGQAKAALTEYEASMKNAPMRLRGFYGAAKAADAVGDTKKAREYFDKLARLTRQADSNRTELLEARKRVASK